LILSQVKRKSKMPTLQQLKEKARLPKWYKDRKIALAACPQKKGTI
jgi:ribosomal protein S12